MNRFRRYWVVWHIIVSPKAGGSGSALSHFDSTLRRRAQLASLRKRGVWTDCWHAEWRSGWRMLESWIDSLTITDGGCHFGCGEWLEWESTTPLRAGLRNDPAHHCFEHFACRTGTLKQASKLALDQVRVLFIQACVADVHLRPLSARSELIRCCEEIHTEDNDRAVPTLRPIRRELSAQLPQPPIQRHLHHHNPPFEPPNPQISQLPSSNP